eukprot:TRINITY_DN11572_c0_g1_i1.p1 TRINITY_DN11572_c0_g1~~TRINITY_DN11572_c0_g1_i1.p1  ORF type:complete len:268 (+),score=29.36 TRINITY_DN11572_c0_g1_i1:65-868(+)
MSSTLPNDVLNHVLMECIEIDPNSMGIWAQLSSYWCDRVYNMYEYKLWKYQGVQEFKQFQKKERIQRNTRIKSNFLSIAKKYSLGLVSIASSWILLKKLIQADSTSFLNSVKTIWTMETFRKSIEQLTSTKWWSLVQSQFSLENFEWWLDLMDSIVPESRRSLRTLFFVPFFWVGKNIVFIIGGSIICGALLAVDLSLVSLAYLIRTFKRRARGDFYDQLQAVIVLVSFFCVPDIIDTISTYSKWRKSNNYNKFFLNLYQNYSRPKF